MIRAEFCIVALEEAPAEHGKPNIFNTDQGYSIHRHVLYCRAAQGRRRDQYGRQDRVARQCSHRAAIAVGEVRESLPARLRQRLGGESVDQVIPDLLQRDTPTFGALWAQALPSILRFTIANPDCSMTSAEIHSAMDHKLFRQPEPPQLHPRSRTEGITHRHP